MSAMDQSIEVIQDRSSLTLLRHYIGFFEQSVDNNLVCLCGMLLAEDDGLPQQLRSTNQGFVDWQFAWLEGVLTKGKTVGEISFQGPAKDQASFIYSAIQGAHIVAKFQKDRAGFDRAMQRLISQFEP